METWSETVSTIGAKIWKSVPQERKSSPSLKTFKARIKVWKRNCPCRLCKQCIKNLGYIKPELHFEIS